MTSDAINRTSWWKATIIILLIQGIDRFYAGFRCSLRYGAIHGADSAIVDKCTNMVTLIGSSVLSSVTVFQYLFLPFGPLFHLGLSSAFVFYSYLRIKDLGYKIKFWLPILIFYEFLRMLLITLRIFYYDNQEFISIGFLSHWIMGIIIFVPLGFFKGIKEKQIKNKK